ncbi:hypothetical protein A6R68_01346 [Neotoma lepida]|uniref:Uncharacterized protein n=1 Tax=Neotoma lepida TaxID=56216 RepID=A0A1A6GVY8_NEOLE|nr:hypothetical protein A6R68_01346 [Neotoma lepida]
MTPVSALWTAEFIGENPRWVKEAISAPSGPKLSQLQPQLTDEVSWAADRLNPAVPAGKKRMRKKHLRKCKRS